MPETRLGWPMRNRILRAFPLVMLWMMQAQAAQPAHARGREFPVTMDYSAYPGLTEELSNAIFFKMIGSRLVTPNVDGPTAMTISLRSMPSKAGSPKTLVIYATADRIIYTATYPCAPRRFAVCAASIVKGAERAARLVNLIP